MQYINPLKPDFRDLVATTTKAFLKPITLTSLFEIHSALKICQEKVEKEIDKRLNVYRK